MDYDLTSVAQRYDSARELPTSVMRCWQTEIHRIAPLRPGSKIADVGCGTGRFSGSLADAYGGTVVGFDRSTRMLSESSRRHGRVRFCLADAKALPLRDASIGMFFLSNVIHHFDNLQQVASGFTDILLPDGYVVIRNYVREDLPNLPYMRFFPRALELSEDSVGSRQEVVQAFERAGFQLASYRSIDQPAASSPEQYLEKIDSRVYSDLVQISDEEFERGASRMREAVAAGWTASLTERIGLFAFRRESEGNVERRNPATS